MLKNSAEVAETINACARIVEEYADEHRSLWAVIAALRSCEDWVCSESGEEGTRPC